MIPKGNGTKVNSIVSFIGLILLLLGIFATVKTGVNLVFFKKYPTYGVLSLNFMGMPPFMSREEDCLIFPQTYFNQAGAPRVASDDEKRMEKLQKEMCIGAVKQNRESAKINDISTSLLFLFLGVGVLVGKKYVV